MIRLIPSVVQVSFVTVLGCIVFASASADTQPALTPVPLCEIVKGFAGEMNHQFSLMPEVETDPAKNEAIVIAIRPVPYDPRMGPVEASISASFILRGVTIPLRSDSDGIIVIKDTIPKGTVISLDVSNLRTDGSTPFALYSYVANRPHCFLPITPSSLFYGPIPAAVGDPPHAAKSYFIAYPPQGYTASFFTFFLDGGPPVAIAFADSADKIKKMDTIPLTIGEKPWIGTNPVFFEVSPVNIGSVTVIVKGTIQWRVSTGSSLVSEVTPSTGPISSQGTPAKIDSNSAAKAKGVGLGLFLALFSIVVCGYFITRSIYNYRIKDITDFPMFIPHHSIFSTTVSGIKDLMSRVNSRRTTGRWGYSNVDQSNDDNDVYS
eukprot:Tbor_TRINITY_DN5225_c0_g1::TRINITY_DN5225_c0_g1_i1::g.16318::m.16318